jgi:hypothetical protein
LSESSGSTAQDKFLYWHWSSAFLKVQQINHKQCFHDSVFRLPESWKSVRHSVWQTMKICPTDWINQNLRKTCLCISKTRLGFNFFPVKIGTWSCFYFSLNFCLRSILFILLLLFCSLLWCSLLLSCDVDFSATPLCIHGMHYSLVRSLMVYFDRNLRETGK